MTPSSLGTAACFLLVACGPDGSHNRPAAGAPWFEECSAAAGIDFVHRAGHDEHFYMPEIMGGGAALFDMDGDGDLDAYLVQSGSIDRPGSADGANQLYANDGQGHFTNVTEESGAGDRGYGMGVAVGDHDGDGDTDLYVTNVGRNTLLRNDGSGHFEDITEAAGVGDGGWGTSATFFDADADGDLDLFVVNYLVWSPATERRCLDELNRPDYCSPQEYNAPAQDVLYVNQGNGTFRDETVELGIAGTLGTGLGVVCGDFDGDGLEEVFVANDGMPDRLWRRERADAPFEDSALLAGCAIDNDGRAKAGMGVAVADLDDDGDLDLLVGNLNRQSDSVFENRGEFFSDFTVRIGLGMASRPYTRFGLGFVDFDNDGYLDLFQTNGRVANQLSTFGDDRFAEPDLLLKGRPGPRFDEVLPRGGTAQELFATGRGAAFGDIDGDGRVDVLVGNREGPPHLLRNVVANDGGSIVLEVLDAGGAPALGASIRATVSGRRVRRDARSGYSYLSASDGRVHLGLGGARNAQEVVVRWADGTEREIGDLEAGLHRVER